MKNYLLILSLITTVFCSAQNVGIGTVTPVFKLDVKGGSINTDSLYRINNFQVLSIKGTGNTFVGQNAGFNTTGSENTALGASSLISNISGNLNTGLGYNANTGTGGLSNATAIGANAQVNNSNSIVLGSVAGVNGASASTRVGIGITNPGTTLHVVSPDGNFATFAGTSGMYMALIENNVYRGYLGSFAGAAADMDFGTGAGNTTGDLHLTIQADPKLTIRASGDVDIVNELHRSAITNNANLVPICYGNVSSTGFVMAGTGNFTVTHSAGSGFYDIAITGEAYQFQQYITVVTPIGSTEPAITTTGSGASRLQVYIYSIAGADIDRNFHFVVYKP